MSPGEAAKVQVVAPTRFGDAKEIADCLKANRPVIVNLQVADRDLQRRMIDFCSGVTYALCGEMEKVADQVFLLAPTNVKVSDEERQRLQERGFGRGPEPRAACHLRRSSPGSSRSTWWCSSSGPS